MKTSGTLALLGALAAPAVAQTAPAPAPTAAKAAEAAVRTAVEHYLTGHATGDGKHYAMVFHPESRLYWISGDTLATRTSADYIAGSSGQAAPDEAQRVRRIVMMDVTGDAAVAKVELDYPGTLITDYFTLLKVGGEWKIMNKIFTRETLSAEVVAVLPQWLTGCWEMRAGNRKTIEKWSPPTAAGAMTGSSRSVTGSILGESEQLWLKVERGRLIYTARPSGQAEASFTATAISDSGFTVTNPEHDFPQKIAYTRRGADSLIAHVEGPGRAFDVPMKRFSCSL